MLLPMLGIYQEYVRNHHYSLQVLAEYKQKPQFNHLLRRFEEKPSCENRVLETFLTYPMHQVRTTGQTVTKLPITVVAYTLLTIPFITYTSLPVQNTYFKLSYFEAKCRPASFVQISFDICQNVNDCFANACQGLLRHVNLHWIFKISIWRVGVQALWWKPNFEKVAPLMAYYRPHIYFLLTLLQCQSLSTVLAKA